MVLREEMYFEPRTISPAGNIRWFGEIYTAPQMLCHIEQTVYIRDNASLADCDYQTLEAKVTGKGIRLLGGGITDNMVDLGN